MKTQIEDAYERGWRLTWVSWWPDTVWTKTALESSDNTALCDHSQAHPKTQPRPAQRQQSAF